MPSSISSISSIFPGGKAHRSEQQAFMKIHEDHGLLWIASNDINDHMVVFVRLPVANDLIMRLELLKQRQVEAHLRQKTCGFPLV